MIRLELLFIFLVCTLITFSDEVNLPTHGENQVVVGCNLIDRVIPEIREPFIGRIKRIAHVPSECASYSLHALQPKICCSHVSIHIFLNEHMKRGILLVGITDRLLEIRKPNVRGAIAHGWNIHPHIKFAAYVRFHLTVDVRREVFQHLNPRHIFDLFLEGFEISFAVYFR